MFKVFNSGILILCMFLIGCGDQVNEEKTVAHQTVDPAQLTKKAIEIQNTGAYDEAIEVLNQALKVDPQYAPSHFQKGFIYEEWDKREDALKAYKKAVEINPSYEEARLGLASVYGKSVLNALAVEQLLKVAETRKGSPEIFFKIALEYWYLQDIRKTREYYSKVIQLDPEHLQAHLNLISVHERLKNWGKAIEEIEIVQSIAGKANNQYALGIAEKKLPFIKGRMNLTQQEMKRKTEPPFD